MIVEAIRELVDHGSITGPAAAGAVEAIMRGEATPAQIGSFLTALRIAGETPEVVAACLEVTIRHAEQVPIAGTLDIVGTGADGFDTFNVSTAAAIVVAGAGVPVAKHGNRAASSKCGSADVLEALGANLDLGGPEAAAIIADCGFCFLFAQRFHPALRHAGPPRREIGIRTIFNLLGPLSNPARPSMMLVGVSLKTFGPLLAETFRLRGVRALVVHSAEGLDEISPAGPTFGWTVDGTVREVELTPGEFGLPVHPIGAVAGGGPAENAATLRTVLGGAAGPVADFVLANAAAALRLAGKAESLRGGVAIARESIASGRATAVLDRYIALTGKVAARG